MSRRKKTAPLFSGAISLFTVAGKAALLNMLAARPLKAALYDESGLELSDGLGYASGGVTLQNSITGTAGDLAFLSFQDPAWPSAGFAGASQMRIYDADSGTVYAQLNFAQPLNGQGATFRVELPPQLITL
jgi:hypothetical protein